MPFMTKLHKLHTLLWCSSHHLCQPASMYTGCERQARNFLGGGKHPGKRLPQAEVAPCVSHLQFESERKKVKSLSCVQLFATPWTAAYQAPLSMGFSRQEYWSGLPFPSPGHLPDPGIEPRSPILQAGSNSVLHHCIFLLGLKHSLIGGY